VGRRRTDYRHIGFPMTETARTQILTYMNSHPREQRPKHTYTLEEFGFTPRKSAAASVPIGSAISSDPRSPLCRRRLMLLENKVIVISGIGRDWGKARDRGGQWRGRGHCSCGAVGPQGWTMRRNASAPSRPRASR